MGTLTVAAATADAKTLTALEEFTETLPTGTARRALEAATETLRSGRDVIIASADDSLTTSQTAKILGVSRAHLYKVLDSGALPYTTVGARDRRISMADLQSYIAKAEALRRTAASTAAKARQADTLVLDEM